MYSDDESRQVVPCSGRTHQIRLHLAAAGLPIIGDALYGMKVPQARRQCLHASSLTFQHPVEGRQKRIDAPLPEDMQQVLSTCQLDVHVM
jgi:23S rRNA pseudouridine1911/1915/1917 synthase